MNLLGRSTPLFRTGGYPATQSACVWRLVTPVMRLDSPPTCRLLRTYAVTLHSHGPQHLNLTRSRYNPPWPRGLSLVSWSYFTSTLNPTGISTFFLRHGRNAHRIRSQSHLTASRSPTAKPAHRRFRRSCRSRRNRSTRLRTVHCHQHPGAQR